MMQYKISIRDGLLIGTDFDNRTLEFIRNTNGDRDWMWFVKEDGKLIYDDPNDGYHFEENVNEGDIVILMYWLGNARRITVIHDKSWYKLCIEKAAIQAERSSTRITGGDTSIPCSNCDGYENEQGIKITF